MTGVQTCALPILEAYIDKTFFLGRRPLYFGEINKQEPQDDKEKEKFVSEIKTESLKALAECDDPYMVKSRKSLLVYFSIGESSLVDAGTVKFFNQYMVAFWKTYPLPLSINIASAFRMILGRHNIRVDAVNAATRDVIPITTVSVESRSSCIISPINGNFVVKIPSPGLYFINAYIDDSLTVSWLLVCETEKSKFSYTLPPAETQRVSDGELIMLLKRSQNNPS